MASIAPKAGASQAILRFKDMCGGKLRVYENGAVFQIKDGKECVPTISNTAGYASIRLPDKNHLIHRLVASAFIPNPENKPQVNHKDGDKRNNNAENLEWATAKENVRHAYSSGLIKAGQHTDKARYTDAYQHEPDSLRLRVKLLCNTRNLSINQLEKECGFSNGSIARWNIHTPNIFNLKKVADYFGVTAQELLEGLDFTKRKTETEDANAVPETES